MSEHILKTAADHFDAVKRGEKTFEVRVNDRGFQTGDTLRLRRVERDDFRPCMHSACEECGPDVWLTKVVTYVYSGDPTLRDGGGIVPGHVVMGLADPSFRPEVEGDRG